MTDSGLLIFTASYFSCQLVFLTLLQPLMPFNYNLLKWPVCDFWQAVGLACGINACLSELDQKSTRCFIRIHNGKRETGCKVSRLVWLLGGIIVCNFLFYRCWSLKISTLKKGKYICYMCDKLVLSVCGMFVTEKQTLMLLDLWERLYTWTIYATIYFQLRKTFIISGSECFNCRKKRPCCFYLASRISDSASFYYFFMLKYVLLNDTTFQNVFLF